MTPGGSGAGGDRPTAETFDADWLALREPADHRARDRGATVVLRALDEAFDRALLAGHVPTLLDLGCGSGSDVRWLAPRVSRPQHWVVVDHDPDLLRRAVEALEEGPPAVLSVTARQADLAELTADDLAGVDLVATSALLDLLTGPELHLLVDLVLTTGTPLLAALTVTGDVRFDPGDPLDAELAAAFDAHQRRGPEGARRLGPAAPLRAAAALSAAEWRITTADTPWELGADDGELLSAWLDGWVAAAVEQRPDLTEAAGAYVDARRRQIGAGLTVHVGHRDLLAVPPAR